MPPKSTFVIRLQTFNVCIINRGYYMAKRRYKISLRVLNNISQVSIANEWNIFKHEKRNFVSPSGHVIFISIILLYKHQWIPNLLIFTVKDTIYYVTIATMIFLCVKITCFCENAYLVFHWCLSNNIFHFKNYLYTFSFFQLLQDHCSQVSIKWI